MKLIIRALFDKNVVEYEVPVGMGDKSFKWLGMTVSQRFGTNTPNGAVRRRDPVRRGTTANAMHQSVEVALEDGQIPHPNALISDFCRDGDVISVNLLDRLGIDPVTGIPSTKEWASLAFVNAENNPASSAASGSGEGKEETETEVVLGEHHYTDIQKEGRAQFMRILLKPQMRNTRLIQEKLAAQWGMITKCMPMLTEEDKEGLQSVLCEYWEYITEVYDTFVVLSNGVNGRMPKEGLYKLFDETRLFKERELELMTNKVYTRVCAKINDKETSLSLGGFLIALILLAQMLYNDTYDDKNHIVGAGPCLQDILESNFIPLAERFEMRCMLKTHFCERDNLSSLREWHNQIFEVFNHYAGRSRELPSSISYKDLTDLLYDAGILEAAEYDTKGNAVSFEFDTVAALLKSVREGSIHGRIKPHTDSDSKNSSSLPDDIIPEDEFTLPEMVEGICRHSFAWFRGTKPDEETGIAMYFEYVGDMSVQDCFFKGFVQVIGTLQKKKKV